jgi:glutamine synthetase
VWGYETEGGRGQWEISLCPLSPLADADAHVFTSETTKSVAYQQGLHATMHPRPPNQRVINALHVVSSPETNGERFLAGILKHATALSATPQGDGEGVKARAAMLS